MKIQNKLKSNFNNLVGSSKRVDKVKGQKKTFLEELKGINQNQIKSKLDELLELINKQGERLGKHRTFKELIRYKNMVKNFVKEAVDKMYQIKEDYSPIQGKIHTTVESVDSSLEELTKLIVDDQSAQLDILEQLDEIRGLLIDLYR